HGERAGRARDRRQAREAATALACRNRADRQREADNGASAGEPRDTGTDDAGYAFGTRACRGVAAAGFSACAGTGRAS
ncbi:hypothetical protein, partial [Bradyrhizobium viridifuturi]|uniref:hypothetical protein n=1 Tax=Bradyrhizobium viridifuturi TaxID=1654716 RepID=UPI000AD55C7C